MRWPWQRDRIPAEVRETIPLRGTERVLTGARTRSDGFAVATDRALFLVDAESVERLRWDQIDRVSWNHPEMLLDVRDEPDSTRQVALHFADPWDLTAVVRDRVTNSIVVNEERAIGDGTVRIVARRNPDTGLLEWRVIFGSGIDPSDPAARAAADGALRDLRGHLGV